MKVPFYKVQFLHARVSFPLFIEELGTEVKFEIDNPDIRPEFEAVKDYFVKALKKKLITVSIEIRYNTEQILSAIAKSDDVDKINNTLIDCVKFEFVKKEIVSFRSKKEGSAFLHTLDSLVTTVQSTPEKIFKSDQELIDEILNVKNSKHYHQIKYLSSQHLSSTLKVRFILDPFSFLFLLTGEKNYYIVWETLNSEEATYIWHFEKSIEALRQGLNEIENILNDIKTTSKQDYLKKDHSNFSRIVHDYTDTKKGFVDWKCTLEERLT